jgi:predicted glycosyltransferase
VNRRPVLFFYCQHSLGLGHLVRAYLLADELARHFDVTLVQGGIAPRGLREPDGVEVLQLPALAAALDGSVYAPDEAELASAFAERRRLLLDHFAATSPDVLVVELYPFGRKQFAAELLPLLEAARESGCRVVCSVRDILVERGPRQGEHDERACVVLNSFFDAVLVHSDPAFARLEHSFRPPTALQVPVHHTGFVVSPHHHPASRSSSPWRLLVSAGGGAYGEELLLTAIRSRRLLEDDVELRIVAGPLASDESWERLQAAAAEVVGVELVRSVPDLEPELVRASGSLSQCGYNTTLALIRARVPALVVPFDEKEENEQPRRAQRLAALGALRVLEREHLNPERLARELTALRAFVPRRVALKFDGARESARIIAELVRTKPRTARRDWLDPIRRAVAERDASTTFFFRDDDVGWARPSLIRLLDVFAERGAPIDLAAIPVALAVELADELARRAEDGNLRLHQHGTAHVNHEPTGRKYEFGPSRSRDQQCADLEVGRDRLAELAGPLVDPIFTPPWNRCTDTTAACLQELGIEVLSRDTGPPPIKAPGLVELPVSIDWFGHRRLPRSRAEIAVATAIAIAGGRPVGLMLHHADLDEDGRRATAELLDLLTGDQAAVLRPMLAVAERERTYQPETISASFPAELGRSDRDDEEVRSGAGGPA